MLASYPLLLRESAWVELRNLSERLFEETLAAERELSHRPELHRDLGLPRPIRSALRSHPANGDSRAARVMRFDFHFTSEGWRISEVNSDVPGGFIEAGGFTRLLADFFPDLAAPEDPGQVYAQRLLASCGGRATVAFVHATAHSDDRQVMEYLGQQCRALGLRTVMASPMHIEWRDGTAQMESSFFRGKLEALVRFFPGEWLPNLRRASCWRPWFHSSQTLLSNPGSALLVQSKRFPLVWDKLRAVLPTWRSLLPQTCCPRSVSPHQLSNYVLKPVFGRVGEDIVMPALTSPAPATRARRSAQWFPASWVVQQPFHALSISNGNGTLYPCFGVFCIDGRASGVYGRIADQPLIDQNAQDIAVLIESEGAQP